MPPPTASRSHIVEEAGGVRSRIAQFRARIALGETTNPGGSEEVSPPAVAPKFAAPTSQPTVIQPKRVPVPVNAKPKPEALIDVKGANPYGDDSDDDGTLGVGATPRRARAPVPAPVPTPAADDGPNPFSHSKSDDGAANP